MRSQCLEVEVEIEGDLRLDLVCCRPGILLRATAAHVHVDATLCRSLAQ